MITTKAVIGACLTNWWAAVAGQQGSSAFVGGGLVPPDCGGAVICFSPPGSRCGVWSVECGVLVRQANDVFAACFMGAVNVIHAGLTLSAPPQ